MFGHMLQHPSMPIIFPTLEKKKKNEEGNFHTYNLLTHECVNVVKPMDKDSLFKKKKS